VAGGCGGGGNEVKVTGSVTRGGKAQDGAKVSFIPTDPKMASSAKGTSTDADGKFEIMVLPGKYTVLLTRHVDRKGNVPKDSENPKEDFTQLEASGYLRQVFPSEYGDPKSTPIGVEIPPGGKDLPPFTVGP
jgi:hypothetical protein